MLAKLSQYLPFVLIAILLLSQFQRGLTRPGTGSPSAARRTVTMLGAGVVLGMWIAVLFLLRVGAPDWTGVLPFAAAAGVVYLLRRKLTAFPTNCRYCGRRLPVRITFGIRARPIHPGGAVRRPRHHATRFPGEVVSAEHRQAR